MVKSSKTKKNINGNSSPKEKRHEKHESTNTAGKSKNEAAEKLKDLHQKFTKAAKESFENFTQHAKDAKVDHKALIESHQKNLRVLNEANKKAAEVMKSIASLQSQFVKQTFEDFNAMMRGMMTQKAGEPIDFSAHSETLKNTFERTLDHAHKVGNVLSKSGKEIYSNVQDRMEEGKDELKAHLDKHRTHH